MVAGDQVGIGGYNSTNRVAAVYPKKDPLDRMIDFLDKKNKQVPGFPTVDDDDPYKFSRGHRTSDASESKVYSDMNVPSLGAKDGSLIAMANTENRGITTAAPETKVAETKRMAGGFFSPQNFQKSGVPDATIMTGEQVRQSLTGDPGYTRFGSLDRPGTQAAKDTAAFNERVKTNFFSPVKADARSIAERRESNVQSMRDEARIRDAQFKETGKQTFGGRVGERVSGDDTYGTNVMSNPAFGFRSKMSAENQKKYDASAAEATRRSEVEPSKGNLIQSTVNIGKRIFNTAIGANEGTAFTKEVKLEKRGEAEQRRYEKYLNRPTYQKEATARKEAGITNQATIAKNKAQVAADAAARTKEFESNKRAAAVERAAKRTPENKGSGRDGSFGRGTTGKGMPSNPPGMRQTGVGRSANNLSRHSTGSSANQPSSTPSGDPSFSSYVRGGGVGQQRGDTGGMKDTNIKSIAKKRGFNMNTASGQRAARKAANRAKAQNAAKKRNAAKKKKCDIRCKYDIRPLTNMNLIMDDLAEVAYFVKEIQK